MFLKFYRNTRRTLTAACVMSVIALSSCSDDDTPTTPGDSADPKVTLKSSATSDVVWNTVTLTIEATDDQEIAQIELKIDGTSVKTATTSPFEFSWDTQKAAEGAHTITAIGTDKSGKSATAELKVTVQNVLLKTTVPGDFLAAGAKGFIFLSDKDGKLIVSKEFLNGDAIELTSASFNESTFSVTQAVYPSYEYATLTTILNVSRGSDWKLAPDLGDKDFPPAIGTVTLNMVNAKDGVGYRLQTNRSETDFVKGGANPTLGLVSSPGVLYVHNETDDTFGFYSNVQVGTTKTIDLSQANRAFTKQTLHTPSGFSYASWELKGLPTATTTVKDYVYLGGNGFDTEYTVSYPANAFPAYSFVTQFYGDNVEAYNELKTGFDMVPLNVSFDVTLKDNKYTGTVTSSNADYVFLYMNGEDGFNFDWYITAPIGKQSVVIPELPAALDALLDPINVEGAEFGATVFDYVTLTGGYDGLLQYIKTSPDGMAGLYKNEFSERKEITFYMSPVNSGSRKSNAHRSGIRK